MSENRKDMKIQQDRPMGPGGRGHGGPMGGFGRPVEKAKNFKGSLKRLIGYLRPHRINLLIVLVFAIASTALTVYAPQEMKVAMNKLQDGYMAKKMLDKMGQGQRKGVAEIDKTMSDAQKKAYDSISSSMTDVQKKAVDQIETQMADTQTKALDQIYTQLSTVQRTALDQIYKQLGGAQRKIAAGISLQLEQLQAAQQAAAAAAAAGGQAGGAGAQPGTAVMPGGAGIPGGAGMPAMDAATMKALQDFMKLPMLDTVKDPNKKADIALKIIAFSSKMAASGQMPTPGAGQSSSGSRQLSPAMLKSAADFIKLPLLDNMTDPAKKADAALQLISLSSKMPQTGSTTQQTFSADTLAVLGDFLKLPELSTITDENEKKDVLLKLIDTTEKMPDMGKALGGTQNGQALQFSPKMLGAVRDFLKLPMLDNIKDQKQKSEAILTMLDTFGKLPDMQQGGSSQQTGSSNQAVSLDSKSTAALKDFLKLPMLESVSDQSRKNEIIKQMTDLMDKMPSTNTSSSTGAGSSPGTAPADLSSQKLDPAAAQAIQDFLKLPMLDTLTDANQKADTTKAILDLGKKQRVIFYFMFKDTITSGDKDASKNLQLTDDQINGTIKAIRETNGKIDMTYVLRVVIILIIMYLVGALFTLIMGLVMSGVSQKTVRDLRREVDDKLARLPLKYFDMHPHGDILSRVTNDIDTVAGTLQQSLTQIITSLLQILGYIIMMLTISPLLTLLVLATLPLYILATTFIAKKSQKYFAAQQKELGGLSGHVEEMYTGHKIVKAFGQEKESIKKFGDINGRLYDAGWKAQFVSGIMFPLMNFISNIGYVLICIVGGIWITKNRLKIGDITAFIQYSRSFTMPMVQTANIANIIQSTVACAERVFEVLDEPEEIPDSLDAVTIKDPKGEVDFEHVDFRYKEEVPLIEDMNLDVKQGHTIAIVGPTGAGKTTLVNLLMRFYEINAGKISIDGIDIREIKRSELRRMFGMVLQDTWLFNGTIKDNIAYGKEGATMEQIVRAAKAAHADHFIRTLPEGYNTVLNEEATNISQGQKQLLTIARAILADPAILILDEATSSVDTRTEVLIQKAMANLMKDRTSFVIAHRLSTIRDAELILVMNKGSIIEQGNHRELIARNGFYADLYNSQFTGANLETEAV